MGIALETVKRHDVCAKRDDGEQPERAAQLLPAADRVEILVGPFTEGQTLAVEALRYDRMTIGRRGTERFATLRVGPAKPSVAVIPERLRTIEPLAPSDATPTRTVKMSVGLSLRRGMDFLVNGEMHHHDQPVKVGALQVHGFPAYRSWEDVVNLPPRSTVRIAWMPDDRPGSWMYHCHILEHHEAGMMGHFEVVQ